MPNGSFALYAENKVLELIVGKTAFATPTVWVGLFTVVPINEDGTGGTEVSAGNYERKSTEGADWNEASEGLINNANNIIFIECAGADWGTINGFALFDALSGGNMLVWGNITVPRDIVIGNTVRFEPGSLNISLD